MPIYSPNSTAIKELNTSAAAEQMKTEYLKLPQSAERQNVASCVLSPSSAKKTIPKVVSIIF